jgi:hypothetical protein
MTRAEADKYREQGRGMPCSEDPPRCDCAGAPFGPVERLIWETVPGGILHALRSLPPPFALQPVYQGPIGFLLPGLVLFSIA